MKDLKVKELAIWVSGGDIPEGGTSQCKALTRSVPRITQGMERSLVCLDWGKQMKEW